ncbi:related to tuberin [Cephalotrichum gorgonifer]|uniref:Related to tuberin n=1 Tax=Cephalotrichum gorgonifer TaxID=2041049 RepID=A0AAE8MRQ0_9PEZI|nr:related to tuberin [Cephalotrichum gorgonifer]
MLCRIASVGHHDLDDPQDELPMPSPPGDASPPHPPEPSRPSGLASVFKGLTGAKLLKSQPPLLPQLHSSSAASSVPPPPLEPDNAGSLALRGFSPSHMASFELLRNGTPSERVSAAATLRHAIVENPMNPVLEIWYAAKDMIEPGRPSTTRIAGWELLTECVKHASSSDLERNEYFRTLTATRIPEDFHLQLAALAELTRNGRVLSGFDYDVLPLLRIWLDEAYEEVLQARQHAPRTAKTSSRVGSSGEEKNIAQVFVFIIDIIKFSSNVADEQSLGGLIDGLLSICTTTKVQDDLRSCIAVLNAIVTFASIPTAKFKSCVQVLSWIYCLVSALQKDAWNTLSILCRSHNGQSTVRVLLDILRNGPPEGTSETDLNRDIRGAVSVLRKLLGKTAEKGYPSVPFALLVDGLAATVKRTKSIKAHSEIMRLINLLFDCGDGMVHQITVDEDWTALLEVACECSKPATTSTSALDARLATRSYRSPSSASSSLSGAGANEQAKQDVGICSEILRLVACLEALMVRPAPQQFIPKQAVIGFLTSVHCTLPDSTACVVLDYFQQFRCCSLSDAHWEENLRFVLEALFADRTRSSATRVRALHTIMGAYEIMDLVHDGSHEFVPALVRRILSDISGESDVQVLHDVVSLMVSVAVTSDMDLFNYIVDTLGGIVIGEKIKSPMSPIPMHSPGSPTVPDEPDAKPEQSASNVVTRGYAKLFMNLMNTDGDKNTKIFNLLVEIAKSAHCETDARLTAMKLLFRLRSDWANRIFLCNDLETDSLAALLYRTKASVTRKQAESAAQPSRLSRGEAGPGPTSRTSRGVSFSQAHPNERSHTMRTPSNAKPPSVGHPYHQQWCLPDPHALPVDVSSSVSPILVSHVEQSRAEGDDKAIEQVPLNLAAWLDAVVSLFRDGCDWEVYSYVLVHLPSQLSNHSIFRSAIPQVQDLRRELCEQIQKNSFAEPPFASGLRKADVAICLFHTLTMILSYHQYFQKQEEDDIVRTFVHGIATYERSSKTCIHALSVCCHELPLSTSKVLVQALQKMAQIITQPQVAMHILEFLSGLCRMRHLYVNFREEEYHIVFGIAFRYLQYVRDKKQSHRSSSANMNGEVPATSSGTVPLDHSSAHPSAADDLPQYVYALAYHVITYWFMALKLPDRAGHVGWIAKNLFTDVQSAHWEEQAIITMDFMRRVAFSDAGESAPDPLFTPERFGEIVTRTWVISNSIITIKQATASGWAQITKRQPSGTSSYMVRELLQPPPHHQIEHSETKPREATGGNMPRGDNHILPSQLLVQLITPIPQTVDAFKPLLLPDDDTVSRAIRLFDLASTVDGHKVGVIYVGEGQTKEADILANTSGSVDYTEFLNGLGSLTKLKGATFNTQGLDKEYGTDGDYTFCWRDRVSEIVFHVTTQMPTNPERDPQCVTKKRHIGNDYVNIIFNDSGLPFRFDTFASDFNFVNIVITPESRATFLARRERGRDESRSPFYRVKVTSKAGFPEISPASETKMVSLEALPSFVRQLAVNASVFSSVWANREGGEHVSPWRERLRAIKRLREKYSPKPQRASGASPSPPPPTLLGGGIAPGGGAEQAAGGGAGPSMTRPVRDSFASFRRSSVATFLTNTSEQPSHRSSVTSTTTMGDTDALGGGLDAVVDALDFSRWA